MKKLLIAAAAALGLFSFAGTSHAQSIVWGAAQNMSADTDVLKNGAFFDAATFYGPGTTVNTVPFAPLTGTQPNYSDGADISVTAGNGTFGGSSFVGTTAYQNLVNQIGFGFFNNNTVTISNLTVGDNYQVQTWASYSGSAGNTLTTLTGSTPVTLDPSLNQFATGTFQATSATETFGYDFTSQYDLINAVSVRDTGVPEPATLSLLGMGSFGLMFRRRSHK